VSGHSALSRVIASSHYHWAMGPCPLGPRLERGRLSSSAALLFPSFKHPQSHVADAVTTGKALEGNADDVRAQEHGAWRLCAGSANGVMS
jgi:hypothetical protein